MIKENEHTVSLKLRDHSVSQEEFHLIQNATYGYLETIPKPSPENLSNYYKSEDYISHTDSKRNLFETVYHFVRRFSLNRKLKLINSFSSKDRTLLDIGCGTGDFLKVAKDANWSVCGIEPNSDARAIATKKTGHVIYDVDKLSDFSSSNFDVITLWHVLEHVPNLAEYLIILKRLLKPQGVLIIAVPNYNSYDANHYKEFWAAYDVPRHLWHFNKMSISKLFNTISMKVVDIKPLYFDAFYVSLLSEKYKGGKMNYFKGLWIGIWSNMKALSTTEHSSLIYLIKND